METNRRYRIVKESKDYHVMPWCVEVKCRGFWQQISPWYMYLSGAKNFCKRKNIPVTEIKYFE
jgi:hypothetical protein